MTNQIANTQTRHRPDTEQSIAPAREIPRGQAANNWKPAKADALPPLTERRAKEFAWAEQHLPAEHPGMVVSALVGLQVAGQPQSTATVMARLESQGRTMAQMKAKGWA